jgi:hypothetical protein
MRKNGRTTAKFGRSRLFTLTTKTPMSPYDGQERNNGGRGWQYDARYRCKYKWRMRWCLHWTDNTFPLLQEHGETWLIYKNNDMGIRRNKVRVGEEMSCILWLILTWLTTTHTKMKAGEKAMTVVGKRRKRWVVSEPRRHSSCFATPAKQWLTHPVAHCIW